MKKLLISLLLVSYILVFSACKNGEIFRPSNTPRLDPTILVGEWRSDTDFGFISFTVLPGGQTMSTITCGIYRGSQLGMIEHDGVIDISEFTAEAFIPGYGDDCSLQLEFYPDGESGIVLWEITTFRKKGMEKETAEIQVETGSNQMYKVE